MERTLSERSRRRLRLRLAKRLAEQHESECSAKRHADRDEARHISTTCDRESDDCCINECVSSSTAEFSIGLEDDREHAGVLSSQPSTGCQFGAESGRDEQGSTSDAGSTHEGVESDSECAGVSLDYEHASIGSCVGERP